MLKKQFQTISEKILHIQEVYQNVLKEEESINKYHVKFFSDFCENLIIQEKQTQTFICDENICKLKSQKNGKQKLSEEKEYLFEFYEQIFKFCNKLFEKKQNLTDALERIMKNSFIFLQENYDHMQDNINTKIKNLEDYQEQIQLQKKFISSITDAHVVLNIQQNKIQTMQNDINDDMYEYAKHKADRIIIISEQIKQIHIFYNLEYDEQSKSINKKQLTDSFVFSITTDKNIGAKVTDRKYLKALKKIGVGSLQQSKQIIPKKLNEKNGVDKSEFLTKKRAKMCSSIFIQRQDYFFIIFKHSLFRRKFQLDEFNMNLKPLLYYYFLFSEFFNEKNNKQKFLKQQQFLSQTLQINNDFKFVEQIGDVLYKLYTDKDKIDLKIFLNELKILDYFQIMKIDQSNNCSKKQIDYYFLFILDYYISRNDNLDFIKQVGYIIFYYLGNYYLSKYYDIGSSRQILQIFESDNFKEKLQNFYDFFEYLLTFQGTLDDKYKYQLKEYIQFTIECYSKIDINFKFPLTINFLENLFEQFINKQLFQQSLITNIDFLRNIYNYYDYCLDLEESTFFLSFFKSLYKLKFKNMLDNNNITISDINFQLLKFLNKFFKTNIKEKKQFVNYTLVKQIIDDTEQIMMDSENLFRTDKKLQLILHLYQITFQFKQKNENNIDSNFLCLFSENLGKTVFDRETKIQILDNQTSLLNYYKNIKQVKEDFIRWFENFNEIMNPELINFAKYNQVIIKNLQPILNEYFLKGLFDNFLQIFKQNDYQTIEEINQIAYLISCFFQIEKLFKKGQFEIGFIKQMFLPFLKKWLKIFFQNLKQMEENLEKKSIGESMIDSKIGLYKISRDFVVLLFTYADSLKQILYESAEKELNNIFFCEFSNILKKFLERKLSLQKIDIEQAPFYTYKRYQFKEICDVNSQQKNLSQINQQIIKNCQQINNYDFVIEKLKADKFYNQILFSEISKKSLNNQLQDWIGFQVEALSNCIYFVYFERNILNNLYKVNEQDIIHLKYNKEQQSEILIKECQSIIEIIQKKLTKDYSKQIKSELYRPILNSFIIRISHIYNEYKSIIQKQKIDEIFNKDLQKVLDFFKDVQQDHYNKEFTRHFNDFQNYMFEKKSFSDSKDLLIHYVYKLKLKRDISKKIKKIFKKHEQKVINQHQFFYKF